MKKPAFISVVNSVLVAFDVLGALSVRGNEGAGWWNGMGLASFAIGGALGTSRLGRLQACADVRKEHCDSVVDGGIPLTVNGKPWTKGCQFNRFTRAVIDLGEPADARVA